MCVFVQECFFQPLGDKRVQRQRYIPVKLLYWDFILLFTHSLFSRDAGPFQKGFASDLLLFSPLKLPQTEPVSIKSCSEAKYLTQNYRTLLQTCNKNLFLASLLCLLPSFRSDLEIIIIDHRWIYQHEKYLLKIYNNIKFCEHFCSHTFTFFITRGHSSALQFRNYWLKEKKVASGEIVSHDGTLVLSTLANKRLGFNNMYSST